MKKQKAAAGVVRHKFQDKEHEHAKVLFSLLLYHLICLIQTQMFAVISSDSETAKT